MAFGTGVGKLSLPVGARDHIRGLKSASVTLLEYGDYQCSYCRKAYPFVEEVQKRFGDKMRFVFRHFPIAELHPFAENAAEAAEAAAKQGKFWEMHSRLFTQPTLDDNSLKKYAQSIDIDLNRFSLDLDSHAQANRVREDIQSGLQSGVRGTPSFFINGILYYGSWYPDELSSAIKNAMK